LLCHLGEAAKGSGQCNAGSGVGGVVGVGVRIAIVDLLLLRDALQEVSPVIHAQGGNSPNGVCYSGGFT
jgi:hypothetical protein